MSSPATLPAGFQLDQQSHADLPSGFKLDESAAPTGLTGSVDQPKTFREKNPHLIQQLDEVGDMVKATGKNLYQVSVPGIASSFLKREFPSIANHLPGMMTENAAPFEELPKKIGTTLPLMALGDDVPPEAKVESRIARPTPKPVAPESSMLSRTGEVLKRHISDNKIVRGAKDINYIARGKAETPTIAKPAVTPAPVPETNGVRWGTGGEGPLDLRGKMIPSAGGDELTPFRNVEPPPKSPSPELEGHADILKERVQPPGVSQPVSKAKVGSLLNDSLGGEALKPDVPLKNQLRGINPQPSDALPKDFTPVKSSALRGYKYDPAAKEMTVITKDGSGHIYGDVSPEQAKAFTDNPSSGKAWAELRNSSSAKVAKLINGKRVAVKPPNELASATPESEAPEPRIPGPKEDLTRLGRQSLEMLQKRRNIAKP
jgi:hypothetical protein